MSHRHLLFGLVAASIVYGRGTHGFAQSAGKDLDFDVRYVYLTSQPVMAGAVTVGCAWKAEITGSFEFQHEVDVQTEIAVSDAQNYPGGPYWPSAKQEASKWYQPNGKLYAVCTATNEFNGTREFTVNLLPGIHKASCRLSGAWKGGDSDPDNYKEMTFEVHVPKVSASGNPAGGEKATVATPVVPAASGSGPPAGGEKARATGPVIPGSGVTPGSPSASRSKPAGTKSEGPAGPPVLPGSKGQGSGLMVATPTPHIVAGRPPSEKAKATTPVIPKLELPDVPQLTPYIPLSSSTSPVPRVTSPGSSRLSSTGAPHAFRPGERLVLQDGRSLSEDRGTLVLRDTRGVVVRSFAPGAVVYVGAAGDVTVRVGDVGEPLGVLKAR